MPLKILLADDSVTAQRMGTKILSEAGHEVLAVSNGAAAARKLLEFNPDLAIVDVYMPGYSGLEVCEQIKEARDTVNIPVLLTVGKLEPFWPEDGKRVRADGVIIKPFEASDLLGTVARLMDEAVSDARAPEKSSPIPAEPADLPRPDSASAELAGAIEPPKPETVASAAGPILQPVSSQPVEASEAAFDNDNSEAASIPVTNHRSEETKVETSASGSTTVFKFNPMETQLADPGHSTPEQLVVAATPVFAIESGEQQRSIESDESALPPSDSTATSGRSLSPHLFFIEPIETEPADEEPLDVAAAANNVAQEDPQRPETCDLVIEGPETSIADAAFDIPPAPLVRFPSASGKQRSVEALFVHDAAVLRIHEGSALSAVPNLNLPESEVPGHIEDISFAEEPLADSAEELTAESEDLANEAEIELNASGDPAPIGCAETSGNLSQMEASLVIMEVLPTAAESAYGLECQVDNNIPDPGTFPEEVNTTVARPVSCDPATYPVMANDTNDTVENVESLGTEFSVDGEFLRELEDADTAGSDDGHLPDEFASHGVGLSIMTAGSAVNLSGTVTSLAVGEAWDNGNSATELSEYPVETEFSEAAPESLQIETEIPRKPVADAPSIADDLPMEVSEGPSLSEISSPSPEISASAAPECSLEDRVAGIINDALDRLKPQLVAEIVRELRVK